MILVFMAAVGWVEMASTATAHSPVLAEHVRSRDLSLR